MTEVARGPVSIVTLDADTPGGIAELGGKAANLVELIGAGFDVPDGFCITATAYREVLALAGEDLTDLISTGNYAAIQALIRRSKMDDRLVEELGQALTALGEGPVAVRSSATAEDLPEASFAGQQETVLGVVGLTAVCDAVRRCWASVWSERAFHYRVEQGYPHEAVALAVVVQRMVAADVAGVAFSADPVSGEARVSVEASLGLGESVVTGAVTPDSFVLVDGRIVQHRPGDKRVRIDLNDQGKAHKQDVQQEQWRAVCLSDREVKAIGQLAIRVEAHYGKPMDIEWAIEGGELWLLQARAITTINQDQAERRRGRRAGRLSEFFHVDLVEHFPSPYPLDLVMVRLAYRTLRATATKAGIGVPPVDAAITMDADGIARIVPPRVTFWGVPLGLIRILSRRWTDPRRWADGPGATARRLAQLFSMLDIEGASEVQLVDAMAWLLAESEELIQARFIDYLGFHLLRGGLIDALSRMSGSRITQFDLLSDLDYATVMIGRRLRDLAASVPEKVKEQLLAGQRDPVLIAAMDADWWSVVDHFLSDYGARAASAYQPFSSRPWREDVPAFLDMVTAVIQGGGVLVRPEQTHQEILDEASSRLPGWLRRRWLALVDNYRAGHIMREASVVDVEELAAQMRRLGLAIGRRLVSQGQAVSEDDVKYLSWDELCQWSRGDLATVGSLIERRRRARPRAAAAWNQGLAAQSSSGAVMHGTAASPGESSGPARIITNPAEFGRLRPGDVLVCHFTDPSWTPLFGLACAVVADTGGRLSHAAIVAREYGLPAVLGLGEATSRIMDGQRIRVDGDAGKVFLN